jgi:alpha/beta superfamily hydrolase
VTPFFFGARDKQLLGLHHPPPVEASAPRAVVLCYPGAQEYLRTHWAFRKLAASLAKHGIHALRFDYFATGDSAGDVRAGTVEQWQEDVATAAQELKDLCGASRISLVGFRLGAALAALAASESMDVDLLVLWEPVISGPGYLDELLAFQRRKIARALHAPPLDATSERAELLGFPLPPPMRKGIEAIDLRSTAPAASRINLMVSENPQPAESLCAQWQAAGRRVEFAYLPDALDAQREQLEAAMLSDVMLQAIVKLFARDPQ